MVLGTSTAHVEIGVAEVQPPVPGSQGGDVRVVARVRIREFAGAADVWVSRDAWSGFLSRLADLERERRGDAVLESISPGELRLRLFAIDRAGHMAAEGELAVYYYDAAGSANALSLRFGAAEFEPTLLPALLKELRAAAPVV